MIKILTRRIGRKRSKQLHRHMPALGPHEVKAMLEPTLLDKQVSEAKRAEAQELRELLQEKCEM